MMTATYVRAAAALAGGLLLVWSLGAAARSPIKPALPEHLGQPDPAPALPAAPAPPAQPAARAPAPLPGQDALYDPDNPAYATLQKAHEGLAGYPVDRNGAVDWMGALRGGRFDPRADLRGTARMEPFDMDIVMKNTKEMPFVLFPHRAHSLWLDCANCHPAIFEPRAGAHAINMADLFRGKYCGACHGRVAFVPLFSCERCHRVPHGPIRPWWE